MVEKKATVIIQARTGSTRFPGKVLKKIVGKPSLIHIIERVRRMKTVDKIVIATTTLPKDDSIVKTVEEYDKNIIVYKGSSDDVLDRYYQAARQAKADAIVRITSDNPLVDPEISDLVVKKFFKKNCDYCCNNLPCRTYPIGLDTEVFTFKSLEKAWKETSQPYDREHVTPYIKENPEIFRIATVQNEDNLSEYRWTMDHPEDYDFINTIYEKLYNKKKEFNMKDVIDLLEKEPEILEINKIYSQEDP